MCDDLNGTSYVEAHIRLPMFEGARLHAPGEPRSLSLRAGRPRSCIITQLDAREGNPWSKRPHGRHYKSLTRVTTSLRVLRLITNTPAHQSARIEV